MERYWHYFNSVVEKLFKEWEIRFKGSPLINIGVPLNQCMHSSSMFLWAMITCITLGFLNELGHFIVCNI